jgi:hypothetical protein
VVLIGVRRWAWHAGAPQLTGLVGGIMQGSAHLMSTVASLPVASPPGSTQLHSTPLLRHVCPSPAGRGAREPGRFV